MKGYKTVWQSKDGTVYGIDYEVTVYSIDHDTKDHQIEWAIMDLDKSDLTGDQVQEIEDILYSDYASKFAGP